MIGQFTACNDDFIGDNLYEGGNRFASGTDLKGDINALSYMVGVINKNGCVIAADSLLYVADSFTMSDFQKVFYNQKKHVIWGVIGFYGCCNEDLLRSINKHLAQADIVGAKHCIHQYYTQHPSPNFTINIFIAIYHDALKLHVIDFCDGAFNCRKGVELGAYYAGNHSYMHGYLGPLCMIEHLTLTKTKEKCVDTIQKATAIDTYIHQSNPFYKVRIGGECKWVVMDAAGNIETHI